MYQTDCIYVMYSLSLHNLVRIQADSSRTEMTLLCVLALFVANVSSQIQEEYDVIIMGAGASGIAAAKTLYEADITNILTILFLVKTYFPDHELGSAAVC